MKCIIKQTKSVCLASTIIILLVTCQSPDFPTVFTEPAETRLSEAVNKYYDALCNSQEGWMLEYEYEDSTLPVGRYSFAMKFKTSGEVEVISDISSRSDIRVGYYTVNIGNTVELSFSTYTQLHYLTDPGIGISGKGVGAGFGFLLTDISADGDTITMRQRAGEHKTVYLKKITSSFQEIKDRYVAQASIAAKLSFKPWLLPTIKDTNGVEIAQFKYNSLFRRVDLGSGKIKKITSAVTINREGFLLASSEIPANFPLKDLNFKWDTAKKVFINSESYIIK